MSGFGIIRHVSVAVSSLAMDHPSQRIADGSSDEEREQRVPSRVTGDKPLSLPRIVLSLGILFADLPRIALAVAVRSPSDLGGTPGNVVERLPHLIKNMLG